MPSFSDATSSELESVADTREGVSMYLDEGEHQDKIAKKPSIPGHNRYLIYRMLGREVTFDHPGARKKVQTGVVKEICRNIFQHEVELTMKGGRLFRFKEPTAIVSPSVNEVVFVYGSLAVVDTSDKALFGQMNHYDSRTMTDLLHEMNPAVAKFTRFSLGGKVERRRSYRLVS